MAERLTGFDYCFTRCMEPGADKQEIREDCSLYKVRLDRKIFEKLQHYEDLEEQGRLIILPEDEEKVQAMNEKLLELTDIAEAAMKGAENATR